MCVFTLKETLSVEECTVLNEHSFEESCWCEVRLNNKKKILLGGLYRSPSSSTNNSDNLHRLIDVALGLNYDYNIIVGDFNYPSICWDDLSTSESNEHVFFRFIECLRDNYLTQFVSNPTRYRDGQTSNVLDLLLVDKCEIIKNITYGMSLGASDHISLYVELDCNVINIDSKTVKRNYYRGNYLSVREDLLSVNWAEMDSMDLHESWNFFHKQVTDCTEKHIPVIKNVGKRQKSKWMDEYCFRCVKDKYNAWNKYSSIQMKCQGGNKYALSITVKFDQSTRKFGRISFARLFKFTKHIALLFYLLSPYLLSCMRGLRNVRKNIHIIKTITKFCAHWSTVCGMANSDAAGIRSQ